MGAATIKDLDKDAFRILKAEASRRGLKIGEAASEAFRVWAREKKAKRARDRYRMQRAVRHMDSTRAPSGKWSATREIRRWRESHRK